MKNILYICTNSTHRATHLNSVPGCVFFIIMFDKPALTIPQQISRLEERGLIIEDISIASHYLSNIRINFEISCNVSNISADFLYIGWSIKSLFI
ncbi:hypothetical protein AB4865_10990 [Capnocytophaga sp. ARDL2]|uniref:hypothetical protein n=1 Tax=Capnocytophaga sp. ARDL2 TaxID=3238809 RepID=UPI003557910C